MFERFNEGARRALFFARYAVTQLGGVTIEPEHLVLGVLRDMAEAVGRFGSDNAEAIRARLEEAVAGAAKPPTNAEIPFSTAAKQALERAAVEADDLRKHTIRPEHIVLGVMVSTNGAAARILTDAGVDITAIRDYLRGLPDDAADTPNAAGETWKGLIARQWKGVARHDQADAYVAHLRGETFPALQRLAGFVTATIMKRHVDDGIEFQVVTVWQSRAAIEAFAGKDISVAVVPPAAQALLTRYDREVAHYEIVG